MANIENISWKRILVNLAARLENAYAIKLIVDEAIVLEAERLINRHLDSIGLQHPNVAKIAGQVAFWIRKLKPVSIHPDSTNHFLPVNERIALSVGLAICNLYKDDNSKTEKISLPSRIFRDWVTSFRYNSHSPNSSMTSFELLMCDV